MSAPQVTVQKLEAVIATLKLAQDWSFRDRPLNDTHGHWDVYVDLPSLDFDPQDQGAAPAFLAWTQEAAEGAFDANGVLVKDLPMRWGGSWPDLQMAFAEQGLVPRLELADDCEDRLWGHGMLVLSTRSADVKNDLLSMLAAFEVLNSRGIVALANAGFTQSDGWTDVAEAAQTEEGEPDPSAIFWHAQKHDFDGVGNLDGAMRFHWRGDGEAILKGLREAGFEMAEVVNEGTCLEVKKGLGLTVGLPTVAEVMGGHVAPTSGAPVPRLAEHLGPLEVAGLRRSPSSQPVFRLTQDRHHPGRWALAQNLDARGFPEAPGYVIDFDGDETAVPVNGPSAMGIAGFHFMRDGRLLSCATESRKLGPDDVYGTSVAVLSEWSPSKPQREDVRVLSTTPVSEHGLFDVDASGRWGTASLGHGVEVLDLEATPFLAPVKTLKVAAPEKDGGYSRVAISPDGSAIALCDDYELGLVVFDRETGVERFHSERSCIAASLVRFTADSKTVAVREGREQQHRRVCFYDALTGERRLAEFTEANQGSSTFALRPDGKTIAFGFSNGRVRLSSLETGACHWEGQVVAFGGVSGLAFDVEGTHLVVGGGRGDVARLRVPPSLEGLVGLPPKPTEPKVPIFALATPADPLLGQRVLIKGGAFANFHGTVLSTSAGGKMLKVKVEIFGRTTDVKIDRLDLER